MSEMFAQVRPWTLLAFVAATMPALAAFRFGAFGRTRRAGRARWLLLALAIAGMGALVAAMVPSSSSVGSRVNLLFASFPTGGNEPPAEIRDFYFSRLTFLVVTSYVVASLLVAVSRCLLMLRSRNWLLPGNPGPLLSRSSLVDVAGVLAYSLFVRFALTQRNILDLGGTGYSRLVGYMHGLVGVPGYEALSVLIHTVHPVIEFRAAIKVISVLSALAPPLLLLVGRRLGLPRAPSLLAGLGLASLPLHASLYSSEFLDGATGALQLLGLWLLFSFESDEPRAAEQPPEIDDNYHLIQLDTFGFGCSVLAYTFWCRPESLVVLAPLGAILLAQRVWRSPSPTVLFGLAWLAINASVRVVELPGIAGSGHSISLIHPWVDLPWSDFFSSSMMLPVWLWLPLPLGLVVLPQQVLAVVLVGVVAGCAPIFTRVAGVDASGSFPELFRYTSSALPWIVLAAGMGLYRLAELFASVARRAPQRSTENQRILKIALGGIATLILATPLLNLRYLGQTYGPLVEEPVFLEALHRVPAECGLVVPDDWGEREQQSGHTIEELLRFHQIAFEALRRGERVPTPDRIIGMTEFLGRLEHDNALPQMREMRPDTVAANSSCWYVFFGSYCSHGIEGEVPAGCRLLHDRLDFSSILRRTVEFRSQRLISRPTPPRAPWYDPKLSLELSRVVGTKSPSKNR